MDNQRLLIWAFFGLMAWITYQTWQETYNPRPVAAPTESVEMVESVNGDTGDLPPVPTDDDLPVVSDPAAEAQAPAAVPAVAAASAAPVIRVVTDVARTAARKQSITSSQSALDATQAGYEVGTRNIVDVLTVQETLFRAIRDYSNARYDYVVNHLKLKRAAGTLSPQDIYDLNAWLVTPPAPTASTSPTS